MRSRVIINDSLDAGSQIPWVEQGVKEGYAVLLMNPNYNKEEIGGRQVPVKVRSFSIVSSL